MRERNPAPLIIIFLVILLTVLCFIIPGFAEAIYTIFVCKFGPYQCIRVVP